MGEIKIKLPEELKLTEEEKEKIIRFNLLIKN